MRGRVALLACAGAAVTVGGPAADAAVAPARLLTTATEFRLALSRTTLTAGPALVQLANRGEDGHDLVLRRLGPSGGPTGPAARAPEVAPGALATLRVTLRPGRYLLFCSLPGHRAAGMQARLRVRARR